MITPQTQARFEELCAFIEANPDGRWLILSHDNPDPDSLVSALLLARILKRRFRLQVTLAYGGIIGRAENRELVRTLGIKMSRLRHISWRNYKHFALVDTQPKTGNNQLPAEIIPDLVFDHHPQRRDSATSPFVDIRVDYGATASILAEYLLASGISVPRSAATGVVYAIQSETLAFSRESSGPDRRLYDHFYPLANKRSLGRVQYPPLSFEKLRTLHDALENLQEAANVIVCHLPEVDSPDAVPEIADILLRLEGKTWCLTTGPFEDRLYLALRTTNTRANAGRAMRRLVGRKGKGGGHGMIAGGWITLSDPAQAQKEQSRVAEKFLKLLKRKPLRLTPLQIRRSED